MRGARVTDEAALASVKQANGQLRVEIEALLSMGLPNSPMANAEIRVAGGNFVTARPRGVVDGVDMQYTGEVRQIHAAAIRKRLDAGELVLLSPLGYSPTGEIFNLTMEDVAAEAAIALAADKLDLPDRAAGDSRPPTARCMRELTVSQAESALDDARGLAGGRAPVPAGRDQGEPCGACARVHLLSRHVDGALLLELFTHDGVGTMVTQDPLERLRAAGIDDVGGVLQLIEPLEADGTLVKRSRELLEIEIDRFSVLEHDGVMVGCAALYPFPEERAGRARLPGRPPRLSQRRRRRPPPAAHRGAGAARRDGPAVRADHARCALVRRARVRRDRCRRAAAAEAVPVQLLETLQGLRQADLGLVKPM